MPENTTVLIMGNPAAPHLRLLDHLPPSVHLVAGDSAEALANAAPQAQAILCGGTHRQLLGELWPRLTRLRWIHALAAGLDALLFPELVESGVVLTNSRGVFAPSLGEFAVASMLYFSKHLRRMDEQQAAKRWEPFDVDELQGKTMVVAGYGSIGHESAKRAKGFGMRILATRRKPEPDGIADLVVGPDGLNGLLPQADYLLAAAPLTPETRGMIGAAQIALLPSHCVLINLGRGPVVDETALVQALREKRIRGAALDVFDLEPLPPESPFWTLDNVLLSPHCADHTPTWMDDAMQVFVDNYAAFAENKPLRNVVDKRSGY